MIDLISLITLCKTVLCEGSKYYRNYRKKELTQEEIELLRTAAKKGEFRL
ncbi:MAG: hypothetical protein LHV68_08645 [Elusimicrobia bacterium]|nr:hypothetical protein [Candidatus Liberimonas magnetica]